MGLMIVAPLGALAPAIGPPEQRGPAWSITVETPNPIVAATPSPRDVLANLTNPTVSGTSGPASTGPATATPPVGGATPSSPTAGEPAAAPSAATSSAPTSDAATTDTGGAAAADATSEVGSESEEPEPVQKSLEIPGTSPDAALAAQLLQSQSRFAPPPGTKPTPTPDAGPMPISTPLTAAYPMPQGATHIFPIVDGGSFSNDWGGPRPGGRRHQGIDMFATTGTPVVAVSDGTLFRVGWNSVGGWRFWLRDRWGNEFYHAHLSAFAPAAKEGATVRAGTVIGFVGNSGDARTTPPHVHFEIHPTGGDAIPPFPYVSARPRV